MDLTLTFLGTSASMPTPQRGLHSIALSYCGQNLLFDAGEGCQQQLMRAKISGLKISNVFLSHFHADHILGLPGLLATMNLNEREEPLTVWGPRGVKAKLDLALDLGVMQVNFPIHAKEIRPGVLVKEEQFEVGAFPLQHATVCHGFYFKEKDKEGEFMRQKAEKVLGLPPGPLYSQLAQGKTVEWKGKKIEPGDVMDYSKGRKGRKVGIAVDTMPSEKYFEFIRESDVLVHDSVFLDKEKERAKETFHSTARQAGEVAKKTDCRQLVLTHFSARYADVEPLVKEAREVFPETVAAKDLMELQVRA